MKTTKNRTEKNGNMKMKKNEMKKFQNRFDRRIAVHWMHHHSATVSGAIFRYFA